MFNRFVSKLTGFLSSAMKEPSTPFFVAAAPVVPLVTSEVTVEDNNGRLSNQGRNRCAQKTRSRDELRALRGTSNKGARRMALYEALEG